MVPNAIPYGTLCPWPQKLKRKRPAGSARRPVRVRVRSFVDGHVLRYVSESEARIMLAENADGSEMLGEDGRPMEATARRLSRKKAQLTDIRLIHLERAKRQSACTITLTDVQNNAFGKGFNWLGPTDSMRSLARATAKIDAWPEIHDDRAVVICAGMVYGAVEMTA